MSEYLRQAEAARRLGVTRQAINRRIKRGTLALADGLVDLDEAAALMAPTRGTDSAVVPVEAVADYRRSRELREHYQALDAKLKYETACRDLIDARLAGMALTTAAANMRLAIEALPDRLAARLAAETDEATCAEILTESVDEVLQALQDVAAALAG